MKEITHIKHDNNLPSVNDMKVWRILRGSNYKPFKISISQQLHAGDLERRMNFCVWLHDQLNLDPGFLNCIIWSDETKFTNCGIFKRYNENVWSSENPRENREIRKQVKFSVNVWAGMSGDKILGPHIFNENLNGERYLDFLNTHFQEYLAEIPLALLRNLWFQQDGAPPHNTPPLDRKWGGSRVDSKITRSDATRFLFVRGFKKYYL